MFGLDVILHRPALALYRPRLFEVPWWDAGQPAHRLHRRPALPVIGRGVPG
jgi:hypothetical protein